MRKKRILFCASYSAIEPLGILHLAGVARDLGWERRFHLVKNHNFDEFFRIIKEYQPDVVGFNVYTGNHIQLKEAFLRLKRDHSGIVTIVGGPHPTYFPSESLAYSDYVVMSEGLGSLRKILTGEASPGILPMSSASEFPLPDRETFYKEYPEHAKSKIKSIITMTGCPYTCTYCYNSSTVGDLVKNVPPDLADSIAKGLGKSGRLFPKNVRNIESVISEAREISERWKTDVIYFQDDIFGFDVRSGGYLDQMSNRWPTEVGIPFHAQMRWEMTVKDAGEKRLDLTRKAGGFGLTLAIEAANHVIRREVLDRTMPQEMIFEGMKNVSSRGFKVRTEQITGLPYGATSEKTKMNLDADLELLSLNVQLKEHSGGPTMAWASTLAPYKGTKMGIYCEENGHYESDNSDVPDTFFEKSVLRFPREWIGPSLKERKNDPDVWLSSEELEKYRLQNAELRKHFNFFASVPKGDELASSYLRKEGEYSFENLGSATISHLEKISNSNQEARNALDNIADVKRIIQKNHVSVPRKDLRDLVNLASYFACLPKYDLAIEKAASYSIKNGEDQILPHTLSTAVRHHLYDNVLYKNDAGGE